MSTATPVYFIESVSTNQFSRYTLEVYREEDGQYRLIQRRWNNRLNLVDQESHITASSLDELRSMDLGNKRLVRMLKSLISGGGMTLNLVADFPASLTLAQCREAIGIGPTVAARCLDIQYSPYYRKEKNGQKASVGEINLFLILAGYHPSWDLTCTYEPQALPDLLVHEAPTGEAIKALRRTLGLTQASIAEQLGYKLSSWKMKENQLKPASLKTAEHNLLLLLCCLHPSLTIRRK